MTPDLATEVARSLRGELVGVEVVVSGDALMQVHWGMFCACDDGDLKRTVQLWQFISYKFVENGIIHRP